MNAGTLLKKLGACNSAVNYAHGITIQEAWENCHRGDWMLWFYRRQFPTEIRKFTLAKAYCANTVRHLMNDERSIKAVDVAIKFGYGFATQDDLKSAAADADAASVAAYAAAAAAAAAYAAADADAAAYAAAADADAAAAYAAAAYAAAAAQKQNQLLTANICREYLDISSLYEIGE